MPQNRMAPPILAGLALTSLALLNVRNETEALHSLADAERAFSKRCGEVGFRQSFLENFAPNGVFFNPKPANAQEDLNKQPEEPKPKHPPFEWGPEVADVSVAGDMGYTTGPLRFFSEDGSKVTSQGYYFSVWQRAPGKPWKVVMDLGVGAGASAVAEPAKVEFKPAPDFRPGRQAHSNNGNAEAGLLSAEKNFGLKAGTMAYAEAVLMHGSPSVRVHRSGHLPAKGKRDLFRVLSGWEKTHVWNPMGSGLSRSGDFGYTYGRYETEGGDGKMRKGYFARVWKRDGGRWQLVMDVANQERA